MPDGGGLTYQASTIMRRMELEDRIDKFAVRIPGGCWMWLGAWNEAGYGCITIGRRSQLAHRITYQLYVGKIPAGLDLDHLCRVRCCCNPAHLEPVTRQVNALRGVAGIVNGARQRAITHCPRGHEYTEANTIRSAKGSRECRECKRERNRVWRAKSK